LKTLFEQFHKSRKNRVVKAMIGITKPQFYHLLPAFESAYSSIQQGRLDRGEIQRIPKGGPKSYLDSFEIKLFFILYYLKTYCTFDVLGTHFSLSGGNAHRHLMRLLPVLERALENLNVLPKNTLKTVDDLRQLIGSTGIVLIDGVECACVRPQDKEKQKAYYSGKKKRHTVKPLVASTTTRFILFVSLIAPGSTHDYNLMKKLFDPAMPWFEDIKVFLDLGFLGATKDYGSQAKIHLPHKKPRKSKANPSPELTSSQKKDNKAHAAVRVAVEHAIGGMKHFHCLMHRIRNHLDTIINSFFCLSAGLWNLKITV
jgi:hypothetical protein